MQQPTRLLAVLVAVVLCATLAEDAFARGRMFHPGMGRFMQRDPWLANESRPSAGDGYPDGMNTYAAYHVMRGGMDPFGASLESETAEIVREEGFRPRVYRDSRQIKTIGYGTNMQDGTARRKFRKHGLDYDSLLEGTARLSEEQARRLMADDFADAYGDAAAFINKGKTYDGKPYDCWAQQPQEVKDIVAHMAYQLGLTRLSEFKNFRKCFCIPACGGFISVAWDCAASEMLDSKWARQTPNRANRLAERMRSIPNSGPKDESDGN